MGAGGPDISKIAEHSEALLRARMVTRETALEALHQIAENLRSEFKVSDQELTPISRLIAELYVPES
jgi:hypothetical protein